jgi:Bacterial Ig domain
MTEPMMKFDPNGSAPLLSYRLPDATTYPGRNYVRLELPSDVFSPEVEISEAAADSLRSGRLEGAVGTQRGVDPVLAGLELPVGVGVRADPDGDLEFLTASPLDPALASLRRDDLVAMRDAGLRPAVVRSLIGTLTLMPVAPQSGPAGDDESPSSGGTGVQPRLDIDISAPTRNAEVEGPQTGLDIVVTGSAKVGYGRGAVTDVDARVDGGAWAQAAQDNLGSWDLWTVGLRIRSSGSHEIDVRARSGANVTRIVSQRVNAVLTRADNLDKTPPTLKIASPVATSVVLNPTASVELPVSGTAADDVGVQKVELSVDGSGQWLDAVPQALGDFSDWTAKVPVSGAGAHELRVRARDVAGNQAEERVPFRIVQRKPRTLLRSYLMLVESYRLSSFLGRYGAGRVLKTFSLLPGERTKISVKSWQRTTETSTAASSIVDSLNSSSAKEFSSALQRENTDKQTSADEFKWKVDGELEQGWGTGRAKISAGASGGCNAARERFGKSVADVTNKHIAEASSKRDVTINSEYERTVETGEETSIEREIQNINASRTINFVFRQMNQEFISILHLVDIRIALVRIYDVGLGEERAEADYREVRLMELPSLLEQAVVPGKRQYVGEQILEAMQNVADYQDTLHDVTEQVVPKDQQGQPVPESGYMRIRRDLRQTYLPDPTEPGSAVSVPGIIIAATANTMRTEGIIVDSLLGQGNGLDAYSEGLQNAAVEERDAANAKVRQEVEDMRQRAQIVADKDAAAATVHHTLHPDPSSGFTLNVNAHENGQVPSP